MANEIPEIPFADGNVGGAVRVGSTVRRSTGPWTPAVHALLRHLELSGFTGAPRVLGYDELGREMLSYIPGETSPDPLESFSSDESLAQVARLLRACHDATQTFQPTIDARWQVQVGGPVEGPVTCHNDIAPWNTNVEDGVPVAFIDWDFAAPGPPIWDIAHAVWRFAPLYDDPKFGTIIEQAHRIRVFVDAYGPDAGSSLLETILLRQQVLYDSVAAWASEEQPEYVRLWNEGHAEMVQRDRQYLSKNLGAFARELGTDDQADVI